MQSRYREGKTLEILSFGLRASPAVAATKNTRNPDFDEERIAIPKIS
jgi:hypothetical protein